MRKNLGMFGFLLILGLVFSCGGGGYRYTQMPHALGQPEIFQVYVDANFSVGDRLEIDRALRQWNYAFNGRAMFEVHPGFDMDMDKLSEINDDHGHAIAILKIGSKNPLALAQDARISHGDKTQWALAFVPHVGNHLVYLVRDRMVVQQIYPVVMHEVGHALGGVHQGKGLMHAGYSSSDYQCIDLDAVSQVAAYQHWNVSLMNYCFDLTEQ